MMNEAAGNPCQRACKSQKQGERLEAPGTARVPITQGLPIAADLPRGIEPETKENIPPLPRFASRINPDRSGLIPHDSPHIYTASLHEAQSSREQRLLVEQSGKRQHQGP
jgi:hypothetical protein